MRRIILDALGLSPKEHAVLVVLQQQPLAHKTIKIAKETDLPYATVSFVLRKLEKRKLVRRVRKGKHIEWVYRRNIEMIDNPTSTSPSENLGQGSFFLVVSGMINIIKELAKILELAPTERLYSIQGAGISKTILKKMDMKFMSRVHNEIRRRKIIIEGVVAESVFGLFEKMNGGQLLSHLDRMTIACILPDELIKFPLDIFIFRDRVLLVDYEAERLVRIDDRALSQAFKSFFYIAEQCGKKVDLNNYIRGLIAKMTATAQ
jgi:predicted transcriptional regulator